MHAEKSLSATIDRHNLGISNNQLIMELFDNISDTYGHYRHNPAVSNNQLIMQSFNDTSDN